MSTSSVDESSWLDGQSDSEIAERKRAAMQRKTRAEQTLARLNAMDRKIDTRRKIVLGGAVIAAARRDSSVAARVRALLENELTREQDRRLFGLDPLSAEVA